MNVKVALEVARLDELRERMPVRRLDLTAVLAQLGRYPWQVKGGIELLLGGSCNPLLAAE